MKQLACPILFLLSSTFAVSVSMASPKDEVIEDNEQAACDVLKKSAIEKKWFPGTKPEHLWCEFSTDKNTYIYIMSLHKADPASKHQPDSSLLGWFGVMRRGTLVVKYDLMEDRMVAVPD